MEFKNIAEAESKYGSNLSLFWEKHSTLKDLSWFRFIFQSNNAFKLLWDSHAKLYTE